MIVEEADEIKTFRGVRLDTFCESSYFLKLRLYETF